MQFAWSEFSNTGFLLEVKKYKNVLLIVHRATTTCITFPSWRPKRIRRGTQSVMEWFSFESKKVPTNTVLHDHATFFLPIKSKTSLRILIGSLYCPCPLWCLAEWLLWFWFYDSQLKPLSVNVRWWLALYSSNLHLVMHVKKSTHKLVCTLILWVRTFSATRKLVYKVKSNNTLRFETNGEISIKRTITEVCQIIVTKTVHLMTNVKAK